MKPEDYAEEYERRLRQYSPRSSMYQRVLDQEWTPPPPAKVRAEDQPDPTRSKLSWDEDTQSYVRVRVDVDPHAIDRGDV